MRLALVTFAALLAASCHPQIVQSEDILPYGPSPSSHTPLDYEKMDDLLIGKFDLFHRRAQLSRLQAEHISQIIDQYCEAVRRIMYDYRHDEEGFDNELWRAVVHSMKQAEAVLDIRQRSVFEQLVAFDWGLLLVCVCGRTPSKAVLGL